MSRPGTVGKKEDEVLDPSTSISKNAYALAKSLDASLNGSTEGTTMALGNENSIDEDKEKRRQRINEENARQRSLEAEVMGTVKKGVVSQSDIKERNLSQMISVLHMRLANLEKRQKERFELVKEDVRTDSKRCSSDLKNKYDDEDIVMFNKNELGGNSNTTKRGPGGHHNLVSHADGIVLDAQHLVFRTKAATETAKRLEVDLENAFGNANTREFRGQKKGGGVKNAPGGQSTRSKTNQQKQDLRRTAKLRLEKILQSKMESFVTRSVLDSELHFTAPNSADERDVLWPITVQWSKKDLQRSQSQANTDGEMNPLLLLKYSIERMVLPAHEQLFRWLISQVSVQAYYVFLFWLIKVKFFQTDADTDPCHERFLLSQLSRHYASIITLLAERTHAEHEKDHVYKYFPYLLCSAVYYGFYYLCPGSRHLYTKGFRKTILMQIVQLMNGLQLCPISVKVTWVKLFPEEAHDEDDTNGDEGGSESIPVQVALTQSKALQAQTLAATKKGSGLDFLQFSGGLPTSETGQTREGHIKPAKLAVDDTANMGGVEGSAGMTGMTALSSGKHANHSIGVNNEKATNHTTAAASTGASGMASSHPFKQTQDPLQRTFLTAPLERPGNHFEAIRQNVSIMNARDVSPLMQNLLSWETSCGEKTQPIFRTVPISWCPAGGSDTYKKRVVSKDLQESIHMQSQKIQRDFQQESFVGHRRKLAAIKLVEKKCAIMMSSGNARISQYALDLIKAQRSKSSKETGDRHGAASAEELEGPVDPSLANFDDADFDRFLAEFD